MLELNKLSVRRVAEVALGNVVLVRKVGAEGFRYALKVHDPDGASGFLLLTPEASESSPVPSFTYNVTKCVDLGMTPLALWSPDLNDVRDFDGSGEPGRILVDHGAIMISAMFPASFSDVRYWNLVTGEHVPVDQLHMAIEVSSWKLCVHGAFGLPIELVAF